MEPEDTYRYLVDGLRVVRPDGVFVLSCLPLEQLQLARDVFKVSAGFTLEQRWGAARNYVTSVTLMTAICELAGWRVRRWYHGAEETIQIDDSDERHALGQATCVLERPA